MNTTRGYRLSEKTHSLIKEKAKQDQRAIGATLDIIVNHYFESKAIEVISNSIIESKPKKKKDLKLLFSPDYLGFSLKFKLAWDDWVQYKTSIQNGYKTVKTENIAIANLAKLCQGVEERMIEAIYHSIGNNYKGIYERNGIKSQKNGTSLTEQFIQKIAGTN
jgi:hypothetical protein